MTVILLVILFANGSFAVSGPGSLWQYARKLTLTTSTTIAYLPVQLSLTGLSNAQAQGNDLRFDDVNNNLCNYWIEGTFTPAGTSTVWVNVPVSGTTILYLYYGYSSAPVGSNGSLTFDFFDDFTSFPGTWTVGHDAGSSVTQLGSQVTLSCGTTGPTGTASMYSAFTPSSTSFIVEAKHNEGHYNRIRYFAATSALGIPVSDAGYFYNGAGAQLTAQIFWGGWVAATFNAGTNYLTKWQITDGNAYNWSTYIYSSMTLVGTTQSTTYGTNIREVYIAASEVAGTSTIVDWVRVRKWVTTEPTLSIEGNEENNLGAVISAQTNVNCYGQSNGNATVSATGGSSPYSYLWSNSHITTLITGLSAGAYQVTITDGIGLTASVTATITQPTAVTVSSTPVNITCNGASTGSITLTANGGTPSYQYSINNGNPFSPYPAWQSSGSFTGLPSGQFKVRAKDNNGCMSALMP